MLVLFSQLKKYLPSLSASAKEVSQVFTFTGQMIDKMIEVEYQGKKDYILDLEVRQNRADCFGVYGLARELSAYYDIPLEFPKTKFERSEVDRKLPIEIKAKQAVKRLKAIKLTNLKISESPSWLKEYLILYGINPVNNLVDLTNYVMVETGFPSHVFDCDLVGDKLVWEINQSYKSIVTLKGEEIDLTKSQDTLVISDGNRPLSLSMIGGKEDAVSNTTLDVILEMGVYDGGLVRRNSRKLNIITEAGQRLEKYLDPDMVDQAFAYLVDLIQKECSAKIGSAIFNEYIQPTKRNEIKVRVEKISQLAGIQIPFELSLGILRRLGFKIVKEDRDILVVQRPINRLDILIEEDVIEEVIRVYGYANIPKDSLSIEVTSDITPSHLVLMRHMENILEANGYDEVRSWVLVEEELNSKLNFEDWDPIHVTNSINEEVNILRQSLGVSLVGQLESYLKNNISDIQIFEMGKVFGRHADRYEEHYSLGLLTLGSDIDLLKLTVEKVIRFFEIDKVFFNPSSRKASLSHSKSSWDITVLNKAGERVLLGVLYVSNKYEDITFCLAEINLDKLNEVILQSNVRSVHEVTQKLVYLDTNIVIGDSENLSEVVIKKLSGLDNIWKWEVVDLFDKKATVRVYYKDLSDQDAKALHTHLFG